MTSILSCLSLPSCEMGRRRFSSVLPPKFAVKMRVQSLRASSHEEGRAPPPPHLPSAQSDVQPKLAGESGQWPF